MAHKILIIEDDERMGEYLRTLLTGAGYEAIVAGDAVTGFEQADRHKPDVILLDLMLPAGGGFVTLQKLRVSSRTKNIPVVVLSALKEDKDKKQAALLGVKAYFYKPVDTQSLLKKITELLPKA